MVIGLTIGREYSYIGLGDFVFFFFHEKVLKFVHAQFFSRS